MAEISDEVILLTDHTKFGHVSYSIVAPVDVLDKVVTDSGIRAADTQALEKRGVEVIVVGP
jgi:DeoR/GlpR family transcriptional regulator of sugar metabolism